MSRNLYGFFQGKWVLWRTDPSDEEVERLRARYLDAVVWYEGSERPTKRPDREEEKSPCSLP